MPEWSHHSTEGKPHQTSPPPPQGWGPINRGHSTKIVVLSHLARDISIDAISPYTTISARDESVRSRARFIYIIHDTIRRSSDIRRTFVRRKSELRRIFLQIRSMSKAPKCEHLREKHAPLCGLLEAIISCEERRILGWTTPEFC